MTAPADGGTRLPTDADDLRANEPQGEREQMQERMDGRNEASSFRYARTKRL
jgi:hypothetical protein